MTFQEFEERTKIHAIMARNERRVVLENHIMWIPATLVLVQLEKFMDKTPTPSCDNCGSTDLVKIKGCIVCLKCHRKSDCNGW